MTSPESGAPEARRDAAPPERPPAYKLLARISASPSAATLRAPNVIFCNLHHSGSSAIDPILRDLLALKGYFVTPFGPEGTHELRAQLAPQGPISRPYYHWTHDPVQTFEGLIGHPDYRFIYLHRDPRDAAVSWAHDFDHKGTCAGMTFPQILKKVVNHNLPPHVRAATEWVRSDCLVITFDQIKLDIHAVVAAILGHIDYHDGMAQADDDVQRIVRKYSFESMTGRQRGDSGDIVRTTYMLRKGISGEWKRHFGAELTRQFDQLMGREMACLGYRTGAKPEAPQSAARAAGGGPARVQIVSPPFACGVAWLINALLYLDIRVTNSGFEPDHWSEQAGASTISERALSHLTWHLPVLHTRQTFAFAENLEVTWEHRLDFAQRGSIPTILFVRDPRDAVHSLYRRNMSHQIDFASYLKKEDEWPDHFPGLFRLPPLETFAYFCWFWLAMGRSMPVEVVRFEDAKAAPLETLKSVLRFLGVQRSDDRIAQAIESSSFDSAQRAMVRMEQLTGTEFKAVRKGLVGEWRSAYSSSELDGIGPAARAIMEPLGYEVPQASPTRLPVFEDSRRLLDRSLPAPLRHAAGELLSRVENNEPPSAAQILSVAALLNPPGPGLLQIGAIAESIYCVRQIFEDTSTPQARIALNAFVNLNLLLLGDRPIGHAAKTRLERLISDVRFQVPSGRPDPTQASAQDESAPVPVERNVFGLDIVGHGGRYFAVPAGASSQLVGSMASGAQACVAVGRSVEEVKIRLLARSNGAADVAANA